MEQHETEAALLPNIANQMRSLLSNLYLAASQVIPPEAAGAGPSLGRQGRHFGAEFFPAAAAGQQYVRRRVSVRQPNAVSAGR